MPRKKTKKQKNKKDMSIWEALNEPIAYPSEDFGKGVVMVAALVIMFAWLVPYMGADNNNAVAAEHDFFVSYESVFESYDTGHVAGESIEPVVMGVNTDDAEEVNDFDFESGLTFDDLLRANAEAFSEAATQTLDVSDPILGAVEFLEPGMDAAWNAWLELMQDPGQNYRF